MFDISKEVLLFQFMYVLTLFIKSLFVDPFNAFFNS